VYVNFWGKWALYHENKLARWEAETSAADRAGLRAELSQLTNFLWMGSLLWLIDLLQHVSQLSHFVQILNALQWEKLEATRQMLDTTARLRKQLVKWGPQRPLVEGDFPALQPRIDELLTGKLCGIALGYTGARTSDPEKPLVLVFKRLDHWLEKFEQGLRERMLADIPQEFCHMSRCLDLRALAGAALLDDDAERGALAERGKWIREKGQLALPDDNVLWDQHLVVRARLIEHAAELAGRRADWFPSCRTRSGTVIMRELFTRTELYAGVQDWLCVFELCATHTSNEAVVKSMGAVIDQHAAPGCGLGPEEYARDAFIHRNGPKLHRAHDLITAALDMHFGGHNWRFTNTSLRTDRLKFPTQSKVISRLLGELSRLPFVEGGEGCHPDSSEDEAEADATGLLGDYGASAAEPEWEVERLFRYRTHKGQDKWLVKWRGFADSRNSWAMLSDLSDSLRGEALALKDAAARNRSAKVSAQQQRRAGARPAIVDNDSDSRLKLRACQLASREP
jgi:hypothetical protein